MYISVKVAHMYITVHLYIIILLDMGYAQGMNDLLARFLVVTDSEVDTYWMFDHYMSDKRLDFMETTMMRKVGKQEINSFSHIDYDVVL